MVTFNSSSCFFSFPSHKFFTTNNQFEFDNTEMKLVPRDFGLKKTARSINLFFLERVYHRKMLCICFKYPVIKNKGKKMIKFPYKVWGIIMVTVFQL